MDTLSDDVMCSYNHYAYGSMTEWLYRHVAGLEPLPEGPGYRRFRVQPRPATGLAHARAAVDTRLGLCAVTWTLAEDVLDVEVTVPFGARAELSLPLGPASRATLAAGPVPRELGHGRHRLRIANPAVARPERVWAAT
jgi:alpha-L-rhamnosidase